MESTKKTVSYFLMVGEEKVEVSEKVYKAHRAEIDAVRYHARIEQRCAQPNRLYCCGDCLNCRWHVDGCLESYESNFVERGLSLPANDDIEAETLSNLTMQAVYRKADELVENGAAILKMRFEQQMTLREISAFIGTTHVMIYYRMKAMMAYFRKHFKDFF